MGESLVTNERLAPCEYRPPVDALLRLTLDSQLRLADGDDPAIYAPVHACTALGQLGAVEAIPPLGGLPRLFPDDWPHQARIAAAVGVGPLSLPHLRKCWRMLW